MLLVDFRSRQFPILVPECASSGMNPHYKQALLVLLVSLLVAFAGFAMAWQETGTFCYALDDSFIMMALSKNLAFHQTWGLTRHHFSSTASSPLFAVLLALADLAAGEHIWMPLLINVLSLCGLYFFLGRLCGSWGFEAWQTRWMLAGLMIFMPVHVLLFGSMEHLLHTLIALVCLVMVLEKGSQVAGWKFLMAGVLLSSIRFEGLFEGGILVLWLWSQKQWYRGFLLGLGMLLPVCCLGFYSIQQGWFFLPNSLILKAYGMNIQETGSFWGFLKSWLSKAASYPHCWASIFGLYLVRGIPGAEKGRNPDWTAVVILISLLHFMLARYGHVYRYEAYLMALAWIAIWKTLVQSGAAGKGFDLLEWIRRSQMPALLIFCLALSPVYRSVESFANGSKAIVNIYQQQVQTAKFVQNYYNQATVGAIDVGAIAYYSDCRLEDLWGLGTMDFARLKLQKRYGPAEIDSVCRKLGIEVVIGYGNPIREPGWVMAESWAIRDNRVCAQDTIDFYALRPAALSRLKKNLGLFRSSLPKSVIVIPRPQP